jgi:hypothetical protein
LHEIKLMVSGDGSEKSDFESAITMLQMKMFITISGQKYKLSKEGKEYGWPVTTFCTIEDFFGEEIFDFSRQIGRREAIDKIGDQILDLNQNAQSKVIEKFIGVGKK